MYDRMSDVSLEVLRSEDARQNNVKYIDLQLLRIISPANIAGSNSAYTYGNRNRNRNTHFPAGFFVCKVKGLSNGKDVGSMAGDDDDDDVDDGTAGAEQVDFQGHVLEDAQLPKGERRKRGKNAKATGKTVKDAPAVPVKKAAGPEKQAKQAKEKKPSKIYLEAMAELEAERKKKAGNEMKKEKEKKKDKKEKKEKKARR